MLVENEKPALVCITETHIVQDMEPVEYQIEDYNCVVNYSNSKRTGGVIIYVHKDIRFKIIQNISVDWKYWITLISVKIVKTKFNIAVIYRGHKGTKTNFINVAENFFEQCQQLKDVTIIMGDINIDYKDDHDFYNKKMRECIESAGLKQIIEDYTRVTLTSNSLIDYIMTNNFKLREVKPRFPKISDHDILTLKLDTGEMLQTSKCIKYRNFSSENIDKIRCDLLHTDWDYTCLNVNELYSKFIGTINTVVNTHAPLQEKTVKNKLWFNAKIKHAIKEKNNAYKTFKITETEEDWILYKEKRNIVTDILRTEKTRHYEDIIDNVKFDSKKMWRNLKSIISQKKKKKYPLKILCLIKILVQLKRILINFSKLALKKSLTALLPPPKTNSMYLVLRQVFQNSN